MQTKLNRIEELHRLVSGSSALWVIDMQIWQNKFARLSTTEKKLAEIAAMDV